MEAPRGLTGAKNPPHGGESSKDTQKAPLTCRAAPLRAGVSAGRRTGRCLEKNTIGRAHRLPTQISRRGGGKCVKVVVISGSPRKDGITQIPMRYVYDYVRGQEPDTSFINLSDGNIECYRGYGIEYDDATTEAARLITEADVWLVGTPIYNSFFSGALKNLFEYINYKATAGKVAGMAILASGNIGFTDVQTLLTQLLSYFRVIANPKAVYMTVDEIGDGAPGEQAAERLREMADGTLQMARRLRG